MDSSKSRKTKLQTPNRPAWTADAFASSDCPDDWEPVLEEVIQLTDSYYKLRAQYRMQETEPRVRDWCAGHAAPGPVLREAASGGG